MMRLAGVPAGPSGRLDLEVVAAPGDDPDDLAAAGHADALLGRLVALDLRHLASLSCRRRLRSRRCWSRCLRPRGRSRDRRSGCGRFDGGADAACWLASAGWRSRRKPDSSPERRPSCPAAAGAVRAAGAGADRRCRCGLNHWRRCRGARSSGPERVPELEPLRCESLLRRLRVLPVASKARRRGSWACGPMPW